MHDEGMTERGPVEDGERKIAGDVEDNETKMAEGIETPDGANDPHDAADQHPGEPQTVANDDGGDATPVHDRP